MLTKSQFQTLFGFKPKRRSSASKSGKKVVKKSASKSGKKVVKKSASKSGKKVVKKSNKVGTRMIKGVKRTVYKGKKGGKFYKKADGRKVYFGPNVVMMKAAGNVIASKALEGVGYTLGFRAANTGLKMFKKSMKNKKPSAMGRKKMVAGKKRTVYKSATGAKYYKSAKGNKVYFGAKKSQKPASSKQVKHLLKNSKLHKAILGHGMYKGAGVVDNVGAIADELAALNETLSSSIITPPATIDPPLTTTSFGKKKKNKRRKRKNTRFGNHGNARLDQSMGPYPMMFASHDPRLI